jgi:3-phosphoshikimate 1-carboxyvinyltransferase
MAFAIAGLFAEGETVIEDVDCVATSYPDFYQSLEHIMKPPPEQQTPVIGALPPHE